jgi:hypothetical protein
MQVSRYTVGRLLRALVVPLAVALPPLAWVATATRRASLTPLGRDQGIFQYVGWALGQGQIDYRDVRDVNGPLTHLVHAAFLALGGADEHRFRVLDLAVTGATFALVGACLPGIAGAGRLRRLAGPIPRRSVPPSARPSAIERAAWALAGWVVLSGQYLLYGYWDLAQRETFSNWFLLPAVGLQLVAQGYREPARTRDALLAVAGALGVAAWFGKPTYAVFTLVQLAALVADEARVRVRAIGAFVAGGAFAAGASVAVLAARGELRAFARIQLADVPTMYRFIWPRSAMDIFSNPWCATQATFALIASTLMFSLVLLGELPVRAIPIAVLPVCALLSVVVQAKGFPYHFHPVTAGVHLQWLAFVAWLGERTRVARRDRALLRLVPLAAAAAVALRVGSAMVDSPHIRAAWLIAGAGTPAERSSREYYAHFPEVDYFPYELLRAAEYLRTHTRPSDRVQTYGMDPYVLFRARRLSATPYIYAYDLNAAAALAGGTGARPNAAQSARIRALRDAHEADLLARLAAAPPAAFVFLDAAPLISRESAWDDFEEHCRPTAEWVAARYHEAVRFGHYHVWMRHDLDPRPDAAPGSNSDSDSDATSAPGSPAAEPGPSDDAVPPNDP